MQMAGSSCSSNQTQGTPSFWRIIHEPSYPFLVLPNGFMEKSSKMKIHENSKIKIVTGKHSWNVKVKVVEGSCYFVDGWSKVVQDTKLGSGDAFLFSPIDDSTFQVSVYGSDGYEKDFCDCCGKTKKNLNVKNVTRIGDDDDDDSVGLLDGMEISDDVESDEDYNEEEEEEEEEEEDDDDDDDDGSGGDVPQLEEHLGYKKFITKGQRHQSGIPAKFARMSGLAGKGEIEVTDLKRDEWALGITHYGSRHYLSAGWPSFRRENSITDGDLCFFEFIKSENKLVLTKVVKIVE